MSHGALYSYSVPDGLGVIDEGFVHGITMRLIQGAADSGKCVIIGRGAQVFLHGRTDVFNVLAYAPIEERIRRLRARHENRVDVQALIKQVDGQRAKYVREYYRERLVGQDTLRPVHQHCAGSGGCRRTDHNRNRHCEEGKSRL